MKNPMYKSISRISRITLICFFVIFHAKTYSQNQIAIEPITEHDHFHANILTLFSGATSNISHSHNSFTLGLDYEYRFIKKLGVGVFSEYLFGKPTEFVLGLPVTWHAINGLRAVGSPLIGFTKEENITLPSKAREWHKEYGLRIGTVYDFHFKKLVISPSFEVDLIHDNNTLVYGLLFGLGY